MVPFKVFRRDQLVSGTTFTGPAIIEESDSCIVVPSVERVTIDTTGCVVICAAEADGDASDGALQWVPERDLAALR